MSELTLIANALTVARDAHARQVRKYTGDPYTNHVRAVAAIVNRHGLPVHIIAAALLHDVVEDTAVTLADLAKVFPPEVVDCVAYMTDQCTGKNRAARKAAECARLATGSPDQQSLKLADLIDNTASIVEHDPKFARTYLAEKRALLDALTDAKPSIRTEAETVWQAAMDRLGLAR